jgi:hypothetical protein
MTEFEMATLFNDMQTAIVAQLSLYASIMSGFLIMSFLAAHRLSRAMVMISISLFSWLWYVLLMLSYRELASFTGLMIEMRKFKDAAKGLQWHAAAYTPSILLNIIPSSWIVFQFVFFLAAVGFFFHCRHENRVLNVEATLSA